MYLAQFEDDVHIGNKNFLTSCEIENILAF
jgi:hypothetical protein